MRVPGGRKLGQPEPLATWKRWLQQLPRRRSVGHTLARNAPLARSHGRATCRLSTDKQPLVTIEAHLGGLDNKVLLQQQEAPFQ